MTTFDWVRDLRRGRAEAESLFLLIAFGELVGLPLLPPYYSLRLLPYRRCPAWSAGNARCCGSETGPT